MKLIGNNLYPDEGNWLYNDEGENRYFYKSVTLAKPENIRFFSECTDAEKEEWEREHPEPEPEPEPKGGEA